MSTDLFGNLDDSLPGFNNDLGFGTNPSENRGSLGGVVSSQAPLAVRLRPKSIDEIVGQEHLLEPGSPLRRLASGQAMSVFLWGPPGVGKTTIASVVANSTNSRFVEMSAVSTGVKEVRAELDRARVSLNRGISTVLFIDEVHRFNKAQQDVLLPAVENRLVTLIAATTENPSFSVISPLLSRSLILTLKPLDTDAVNTLIDRGLEDERGLRTESGERFELEEDARQMMIQLAGGDGRRVLTYLEEAAAGAQAAGSVVIDLAALEASVDKAAVKYDKDGDQHYDVISAFIKSVRGSDVDAALHYLARMLTAGEDPRFIARRLIILASEDIGMASPSVLQTCVAAAQSVQLIGMPEAQLTLAHATIAVAVAPKSNAAYLAINAAMKDVKEGKGGLVPPHLRDAHYSSAKDYGHGIGYKYAHDYPYGVAEQQYLPDDLVGTTYYHPSSHGNEAHIQESLAKLRDLLGREPNLEDKEE